MKTDTRKRAPDQGQDAKKAPIDGVYHVVPVTPSTPESLREKRQGGNGPEATDMSTSDALWQSQLEMEDEGLINLSTVNPVSREPPASSPANVTSIGTAANGWTESPAVGDTVDASPDVLGGTLSEVLAANVGGGDGADSTSTGSVSIEELLEDVSRQYMYYAAEKAAVDTEEATPPPPSPPQSEAQEAFATTDEVTAAADTAAASDAEEVNESQEVAREASMAEQPPMSARLSLSMDRSPWSIRDDPQLAQQRQQQWQQRSPDAGTAASAEPIYNKVYDTIEVEEQLLQRQISVAPFVAHLPEPLRSGRRIIVCGQLNEDNRRATISLRNRSSGTSQQAINGVGGGEEEFQVRLEVQKDGSTELTCSQFNGRLWTGKQRAVTSKFDPSQDGCFSIEIQTTSTGFTVRFEDAVCIQPHTLPFSNFTHLILDGNSEYQSVDFPEELELPFSEEFPQSLDLISQILVKLQPHKSPPTGQITLGFDHGAAMLCVLDLPKQTVSVGRTVPETGGFLCETKVDRVPELKTLRAVTLRLEAFSVLILLDGKPTVSYNLLNRKLYITSFFIDGSFVLKDVSWKEKRAAKSTPLPPGFQIGSLIRVTGRLPDREVADDERQRTGAVSCCVVSLVDSRQPDSTVVGFCLRCEPGRQPTLSCTPDPQQQQQQQPQVVTLSLPTPNLLAPGRRFEVGILYRLNGFEVTQLGDCPLTAAAQHQPPLLLHQIEPQRLSHVQLSGGALYYEIEFPVQLSLPYLNRFPVSLKESRFVTAEMACGGLYPRMQQRPTTISFALCCGPGDSGLKPLVCEFNLAQGYASVAWADSAGRLCDEETRKFDPRLTGDVEVVALQATDTEYILSCNETSVLKYIVRHDLNDIRYVLIDGDVCITSVKFEGRAASFGCCMS